MRYLAFVSALALLAGCGQAPNTTASTTTTTEQAAPVGPPMQAQITLAEFVEKAATSDLFEVEAGRLAAQRTRTAAIRDFANMMVRDHTATSERLKTILASTPAAPTPPAALDAAHQQKLTDLRNATPDRFDEIYLDQQTEAHENAATLLRDYAARGDTPAVSQFASETLAKVQAHLDTVRELDRGGVDEAKEKT
ncbi:MAG: DUF4142 domain-containing protein [Hyphomonadaceae bacterium]|nr:DUF4142 domain-containing protein [Hyphomonadaceae bacterium]